MYYIFHSQNHVACFLYRPLTVSTRLVYIALHLSQPTPSQRRRSEASTSVRQSRTFWRETCIPVISSCAHTPVLPTCPNHDRNSQVGHCRLFLLMLSIKHHSKWRLSLNPVISLTINESNTAEPKLESVESWLLFWWVWLFLICPVDVGPASMLVGNLVAGKRIAQATGRELGVVEDQDLIRKVLNPIHYLNFSLYITPYSRVRMIFF